MTKKVLTKSMKGLAIVGGLYLLSEFWYQIGKGHMLGWFVKNFDDADELMKTFDDPDMQSWRPKLVKFAADFTLNKDQA